MTDDLKARLPDCAVGRVNMAHPSGNGDRVIGYRVPPEHQQSPGADMHMLDALESRAEAAEAECERLRRLGRDHLKYTEWFRDQTDGDHPTWPSMKAQLREAYSTAFAADQPQSETDFDPDGLYHDFDQPQGERTKRASQFRADKWCPYTDEDTTP